MSRSDLNGLDFIRHQFWYDLLLLGTFGANALPESPFHSSDSVGKTILDMR